MELKYAMRITETVPLGDGLWSCPPTYPWDTSVVPASHVFITRGYVRWGWYDGGRFYVTPEMDNEWLAAGVYLPCDVDIV